MTSFRTFNGARRVPARAMEPLIDPAGWSPESLRDVASWSYRFTEADCGELINATEAVCRNALPVEQVSRENFRLGAFAEVLRDVRRELLDGRGIVMLQNFPVERLDRSGQAIAYLGLGAHIGQPMAQNEHGHILGHVKNLGGDYGDRTTRGTYTNAEMRFHADGCDYVGLLCLKTAKSGGASRVASSVTLYNRMLERRPDLVQVLTQDFCRARTEMNPGQEPWVKQPMFSFHQGYFSAIGAGIAVDRAQGLPGVPPLTPLQKEAIEVYRHVVHECAADIPTLAEAGFIDFENISWIGFFAPARMPAAVVRSLSTEINNALREPDVRERLVALGFDSRTSSQPEFAQYVKTEMAKWEQIVRKTGITLN